MKLSGTDLVPVLTIIAGGAIGFSLFAGFLLLSPASDAARAGTVVGRVTEAQSGGSIATAQVFIASLGVGGVSQQNGRYLLQNVPAGTHTLTVARIGYQATLVEIEVAGGQTVEQNFVLSEDASHPYMFAPLRLSVARASRSSVEMTPRQEELIRILLEEQKDVSVVRP
jgi:hypothetical protein